MSWSELVMHGHTPWCDQRDFLIAGQQKRTARRWLARACALHFPTLQLVCIYCNKHILLLAGSCLRSAFLHISIGVHLLQPTTSICTGYRFSLGGVAAQVQTVTTCRAAGLLQPEKHFKQGHTCQEQAVCRVPAGGEEQILRRQDGRHKESMLARTGPWREDMQCMCH